MKKVIRNIFLSLSMVFGCASLHAGNTPRETIVSGLNLATAAYAFKAALNTVKNAWNTRHQKSFRSKVKGSLALGVMGVSAGAAIENGSKFAENMKNFAESNPFKGLGDKIDQLVKQLFGWKK